jgi:decaprenylphospho-beta-D-ribofuranose 2-oxidase
VFSDVASGPRLLTGWGRTAPTAATLLPVRHAADIASILALHNPRGVIARGLASSYGDPAQNAGGTVLDMTGADRIIDIDDVAGVVRVDAGVNLDQLMRALLPAGWFVPVTPGTRRVTIGGALAADVHGKNHHGDGSIGRHVRSMRLALADGSIREVGPADDPELFWATLGGMGLTGVIVQATITLLPVETSFMAVTTRRAADLDGVLDAIAEADRHRYSVAWIDCARGGRGIVTSGEHAPVDALPTRTRSRARRFQPSVRAGVPAPLPMGMVNAFTISAFNEAWYAKAPRLRTDEIQQLSTFFHPLDSVRDWNRLYGPRGFLQYQCVVPDEGSLRAVLDQLDDAHVPTALAVLKRFGTGNPGPLSFPRPGWTLALDVPASVPNLPEALDAIDELVAAAGGAVYLAKDARMRPESIASMYPRLPDWTAVRDRVDPTRLFTSDLSRRLSL